jgi:hypothetical protein
MSSHQDIDDQNGHDCRGCGTWVYGDGDDLCPSCLEKSKLDEERDRPTDPVGAFFDFFDSAKKLAKDFSGEREDGRPPEIWVRWRANSDGIEITACTVKKLDLPLGENEHEDSFT